VKREPETFIIIFDKFLIGFSCADSLLKFPHQIFEEVCAFERSRSYQSIRAKKIVHPMPLLATTFFDLLYY
jgi:hypothetical protein